MSGGHGGPETSELVEWMTDKEAYTEVVFFAICLPFIMILPQGSYRKGGDGHKGH